MEEIIKEENQENSQAETSPKPKKKIKMWLVALMLTALIALGSYYVGIKYSARLTKTPAKIESVPQIVTIPEQMISGKITNLVSGEAVANADITLGSLAVKSDDQGNYRLSSQDKLSGEISVKKDGFIDKKYQIQKTNDISLTPIGKIFYVSNRDGKKAIYSANYDGSDEKTLVSRIGEGEDYNITASPHDRLIAFLSTRDLRKNKYNSYEPELYIVKADGSELKKISDWYQISNIKWSPDGTYLAWTGNEKEENSGAKMVIQDVSSGKQITTGLTKDNVSGALWTLDESSAVYTIYSSNDPNRVGIWVAQGDGEPAEKISSYTSYSKFNDDNNLEFTGYGDNKTKYFTWFKDSKEVKEIMPQESKLRDGVKSLDGKLVAYTENRDGKTNLFISNPDKSNEKQLTKIDAVSGNIRWSQDGKYITFSVIRTGESARYLVGSNGIGNPRKIVDELNYGGYGY